MNNDLPTDALNELLEQFNTVTDTLTLFKMQITTLQQHVKTIKKNVEKELKNNKKAYQYYIQSIKQNNKQYTAYSALIQLLFDSKEYKKSYECSKIANKQFQDDYNFLTFEGNSLLMMGDIKNSLNKFEEAFFISQNKNLAKFMSKKYLEIGDTLNYTIYNKY